MTPKGVRLIPRIGLFAALIYVLSWATSLLPNVNLIFFIVFSAGFMWGKAAGMLVGFIGMGLTTFFNPFGPAPLPIMVIQMVFISLSGFIGALFIIPNSSQKKKIRLYLLLSFYSVICTLCYFIPVNLVDAWLFQPFWERLYIGLLWSLISVVSNIFIFTILFPALQSFYTKEREVLC